ncbi:MAG: DUF523 and DUF1722 domain-containing protein [Candidatus Aminicenantes bacterium]|nr:DUF523 and DUF1722 domain-containing protein [Candidatus Aminicenantes bacterium]
MDEKIKLGISSCLLGNKVRFDGGHKFDPFLVNTLGHFVEYVPVCPDVESGFPVPREEGMAEKNGVGIFARALMERLPLLPVEEEGRLQDIQLRENFIVRVFAYRRWRELVDGAAAAGRLVDFQRRHKLLLMAHSLEMARQLGKLTALAGARPMGDILPAYEKLFMAALKQKATVRKNVNVLQHMFGYFKKQLDDFEKKELLAVIENYRQNLIPLIVPLTLLKHYIDKFKQPYLSDQYYLDPHPLELKLRNHA